MYGWVNKDVLQQKKMFHFLTQKLMVRPHLPNNTWFWVITMCSIAVEPSTKHQYGDNDQNLGFCPLIGFQSTPLHLVFGLTSMAIQYNSVIEENMWKDIVLSGKLKGI